MKTEKRIASHPGTVVAVGKGNAHVQIVSTSACASCQAHAHCGFAESKNKTVVVPTTETYEVGQRVTVNIDESRGMYAVWIAYVLPALAILGIIITLSVLHAPEWLVAIAALAVLGIYILLLYLCRHKLESHFTLTIEGSC